MIRAALAESVLLLSRKLTAQGLTLEPIPGTHMDYVVNAMSTIPTVVGEDGVDLPYTIQHITEQADELSDGAHRKAMGRAVDALIEEGSAVIRTARDTVYPLIDDLFERAKDIVSTRRQEGVRQYELVPYRPADIFFSDWMQQSMEANAYRHNAWGMNKELQVIRIFPRRTVSDLIVLCRTDHPAVNALIDQAVGFYGEDVVQRAYDVFFNAAPESCGYGLTPMDLRSDQFYEGERLFAFLMAQGMMKDIPSVNMPLDDLNNYLQDVQHFCTSSLHRYMSNYQVQVDKKYLNTRRDNRSASLTSIVVNDQAYAYWKEQGLTDEALKGALLSDGTRDGAKIMEARGKYEAEWARQEKIIERTIDSNTVSAINSSLIEVVLNYAKQHYGDNYLPNVRALEEGCKVILQKVNPTSDKDLYCLVKEAVLCLFYTEKSVRCYVTSMDEIMTESPSIDPRQAAALAFIDTGVAWLLSQLSVVPVRR